MTEHLNFISFFAPFRVFRKHIETPLTLIQSGMNPSDNLHPFSVPRKPSRTSSDNITSPRPGKS